MGFSGLAVFVVVMWAMILAVAAFLVIFVAPIDAIMFDGQAGQLTVSIVQAAIAIVVIVVLVFGLSRMKRIYMQKKLG